MKYRTNFPENLRIDLHETPLDLGNLDNLVFGRDATRSFLVLKDAEHGKILSEIHGTSYHPLQKKLGIGGQSVLNIFNLLAADMGIHRVFNRVAKFCGYEKKISKLKVYATDGARRSKVGDRTVPVKIGSFEDIMPLWLSAMEVGTAVNRSENRYKGVSLAQKAKNCHAVTAALLRMMAVDPAGIKMHYAAPGFSHSLSKLIPVIREISADHHKDKSTAELQTGFSTFMRDLNHSVDPDAAPVKKRKPSLRKTFFRPPSSPLSS